MSSNEAVISVDILSDEDFVDAAFDAVEHFVGDAWLDDGFTKRNTAEARFLRRCLFELKFRNEEEILEAVKKYARDY